ncbi:MAG: two-component regulator propeller domain-containing protein [Bacteroidota bacterium]
MKIKTLYKVLFLILGIPLILVAQNQQLRQFSLEEGLPQSQVFDMVQDGKGYLWLATQGGGLARFDGRNFKIYNINNGLVDNYVNALFAAKDTLFIGTKRGLSIKLKKKIVSIETAQIHKISRINDKVYLMTENGINQVSDFSSKGDSIFLKKLKLADQLNTAKINDMLYDGSHYWIASNIGLFKTADLEGAPPERLVEDDFVSLLSHKGRILAATASEGLFSFEPNQFEDAIFVLENFRINNLSAHNNGEIWIATENKGIFKLNLDNHEAIDLINNTLGLNVQNVRKVLTDRQGNIWIGTSGGGFYKYFQNDFKHYNTDAGLLGNRIYAVHVNAEGLWLSHSESGVSNIFNGRIKQVETPDSFQNTKIKTISSDQKGNLYFGSDGKGIWLRYQNVRDSFIEDKSKISELRKIKIPITSISNHEISTSTGFPYDWIRSISIQADTIWAATYASGIVKFGYNPDSKNPIQIYQVFSAKSGIEDLYIKDSFYNDGSLWYATQNGHLGFINNDEVNHIGKVLGEEVAINSILINNDIIYLGTAGRGVWWSLLTEQLSFKKLRGLKPLSSENALQLIFDNDGYLWSGSERGVDKISLNQETEITDIFHFGKDDGFIGIETCLNAVDKDENGRLWFGTINGLTEFIPSSENSESIAPELHLSELKVNLKPVDSLDFENWSKTERLLNLLPNQNQISFGFYSVDLNHPNSIEYRTKWNNGNWTKWTTNNSTDFSGLSFGTHKFYIQSRNYRWKESAVKRISIFIERPLHRKVWFQWLVSGIVLLILILIATSYIKRLKLKSERQKKQLEIDNHLLDLEQKALRLQMNPHFMFNVLNGIKAMAKSKPEVMNATINDFAALLRSTLNSSRQEHISLEDEISALHHYIKLELQMAPEPFEYHIELKSDYSAEDILIPPMLIQPFVENSIRHGILKGNRKGKLVIEFTTSETFLQVKISDNGIGIFESQKIESVKDHQSMALKVTKERLNSISSQNNFKIIELKDTAGEILGTEVRFKIPLNTEY